MRLLLMAMLILTACKRQIQDPELKSKSGKTSPGQYKNTDFHAEIPFSPLLVGVDTRIEASGGEPPYLFEVTAGNATVNSYSGNFKANAAGPIGVRVTDVNGKVIYLNIQAVNPRQVAIGSVHICYNRTQSQEGLWCLGGNTTGQRGDETTSNYGSTPETVGDAVPFVNFGTPLTALSSIGGYTGNMCGLINGQVKCKGYNYAGYMGAGHEERINEIGDNLRPVDLAMGTITKVVSNYSATCALASNNTLKCFGANGYNISGTGNTEVFGDEPGEMGSNLPVVEVGSGVIDIELGIANACAILESAKDVLCWGRNDFGQLAQGDSNNYLTNKPNELTPFTFGENIRKLAVGTNHICAALENGELYCWGKNNYGQLGVGDASTRMSPTQVNLGTGRTAQDVAAGDDFTCALLDNDQVKCWGRGSYGSLGYGDTSNRGTNVGTIGDGLAYVDLGTGVGTINKIVAGLRHACVLFANGLAKCWGENSYGGLAQGDTQTIGTQAMDMGDNLNYVQTAAGTITDIAAFAYNTCFFISAKGWQCFGMNTKEYTNENQQAIIGDTERIANGNVPKVKLSDDLAMISAGTNFSCALNVSGEVKCWGIGALGVLGDNSLQNIGDRAGTMGASLSPLNFTGQQIKGIASGVNHSCALTNGGSLRCWGFGGSGRLGNASTSNIIDTNATTDINFGSTIKSAALGTSHTCALSENNEVGCWGNNTSGQLGRGDTVTSISDPASVNLVNLGTTTPIKKIVAGANHNCALFENGNIKCWGDNSHGQLGYGDTATRGKNAIEMGNDLPYVNLGVGKMAIDIAAGGLHTCAVLNDYTVKCWGHNGYGQLGYGHNNTRGNIPQTIPAFLSAVDLGDNFIPGAVYATNYNTCALDVTNKLKCWGDNRFGQLQDNKHYVGIKPGEMGNNLKVIE
jgi:alpha-tubulin suppressor-like RCC1 family protein